MKLQALFRLEAAALWLALRLAQQFSPVAASLPVHHLYSTRLTNTTPKPNSDPANTPATAFLRKYLPLISIT